MATSLTVYEYGVDQMPVAGTCIVVLSGDKSYPLQQYVHGKVRYDYPPSFGSALDAIECGVELAGLDDLWYDENGNAFQVACLVDAGDNDDDCLVVKGDCWCYLHDYISTCMGHNYFPFVDPEYRDIAIQKGWLEVLAHTITEHPSPYVVEHNYIFMYDGIRVKFAHIGSPESPISGSYNIPVDEPIDAKFNWDNLEGRWSF